ncbi:MAG: hypothetical protein DME26_09635 [Verrucomicrobia bacterium]|nr:MAG: hypothetical protein DME26_09635 [Verrucomicrobiota bacterium]
MNDWNIQSRAHSCQVCGKPFADKETYHTLLFDVKQDFLRKDICDACWKGQHSSGASDRKGFVSYWQGVYEAPPPRMDPIQKETAESLLRKLIESKDPQYVAATYILAVMLERKRLLKVKEQIVRDGHRVFIYEQPATGDLFTIPDPNLQLNHLDQVQREIAALLEHGLNPPANQPSAASLGGDSASASTEAAPLGPVVESAAKPT